MRRLTIKCSRMVKLWGGGDDDDKNDDDAHDDDDELTNM